MPPAPVVDEDVTPSEDRFERRLVEETSKLQLDIASVRSEMREGFASIRAEMARDRFEVLKWAFGFWITNLFAMAALLAGFMAAMRR
jgi:hypothetical protein